MGSGTAKEVEGEDSGGKVECKIQRIKRVGD